eukprot:g660.t1
MSSWFNKIKRRAVVAATGTDYNDSEFDEQTKKLRKLEKKVQSVRRQANMFIRSMREANRQMIKFTLELQDLVADNRSPNIKSANKLVQNTEDLFGEQEEELLMQRIVAPLQGYHAKFSNVMETLRERKELLVSFQYYKQLHENAELAVEKFKSDDHVREQKHRAEQFAEAKRLFSKANENALEMIGEFQYQRMDLLRKSIQTLAKEKQRLAQLVNDKMMEIMPLIATPEDLRKANDASRHNMSKRGSMASNYSLHSPESSTKTQDIEPRGDGSVFGAPLPVFPRASVVMIKCVRYLRKHALKHCGLFRVPGDVAIVNGIRAMFEKGNDVVLEQCIENGDSSGINVVATLLKLYLRELPDPLFPYKCYQKLIVSQDRELQTEERVQLLKVVLDDRSLVSSEHAVAIAVLMDLLGDIIAQKDINKMTPTNLAVCLAPSVLKPPPNDGSSGSDPMAMMDEMSKARGALTEIIVHRAEIFSKKILLSAKTAIESFSAPSLNAGGHIDSAEEALDTPLRKALMMSPMGSSDIEDYVSSPTPVPPPRRHHPSGAAAVSTPRTVDLPSPDAPSQRRSSTKSTRTMTLKRMSTGPPITPKPAHFNQLASLSDEFSDSDQNGDDVSSSSAETAKRDAATRLSPKPPALPPRSTPRRKS